MSLGHGTWLAATAEWCVHEKLEPRMSHDHKLLNVSAPRYL